MLPYIIVLIPACLLLAWACAYNVRRQKYVAFFCLTVISLFAGLRGYVGIDTYMYHMIYLNVRSSGLAESLNQVEPVFALLIKLSFLLSDNSFVFSGLISILQGIILFFLIRSSRQPAGFMLLYLAIFFLGFEFNILRAGTAILLLVLACRSIHETSRKRFYLLSLFAILCHYSALIGFLPMVVIREKSPRARVILSLIILLVCMSAYLGFLNIELTPEKYITYFLMDLRAETKPSFIGLGIRVFINLILYRTVVTKDNFGLLTTFLSIWFVARLVSVEFIFVDRVEIIFSALFLFYIIEHIPSGYTHRRHIITLSALVLLSLFSNLKGLALTEEELARGKAVTDLNHSMSPYVPYKFFWVEPKP